MGDVVKFLIEPLEERFEWKEDIEQAAAKADMMEAFGSASDDLLARVAREIRFTRTFNRMPTVGEIAKVLNRMVVAPGFRDANTPPRKHPYPDWSRDAVAAADRLIQSDMGRQAAREGWIVGLHDYCRKHRKLPSQYEIGSMRDNADFVAHCAAGVVHMGKLHDTLLNFAGASLEKRERLARLALGE